MPSQLISISQLPAETQPAPIQNIIQDYNITNKTPNETQNEYQCRIDTYNHLINKGYTPSAADVASRIQTNKSYLGVGYATAVNNVIDNMINQ